MARIRTIKPEFWQDEKLAPLAPVDRLVFLGLISQADDAGRLVDNVRLIDGLLFPETDDTSRDSLDTLARLGRIVRYTSASGQRLIQVANWTAHQHVDKPAKYVLPGPDEETVVPQQVATPSRDSRDTPATPSRDGRAPIPDPRPTTSVKNSVASQRADADETITPDLTAARAEAFGILKATWPGGKMPRSLSRDEFGEPMTPAREGSIWNNLVKHDPAEDVNAAMRVAIAKNPAQPFTLRSFQSENPAAQEFYHQCLAEARKKRKSAGPAAFRVLVGGAA